MTMDLIRRKLVELREEIDGLALSGPPYYSDTEDELLRIRDELDAILADWDAADEIRPRVPSPDMVDAPILDSEDASLPLNVWVAMWDACKQEEDK